MVSVQDSKQVVRALEGALGFVLEQTLNTHSLAPFLSRCINGSCIHLIKCRRHLF